MSAFAFPFKTKKMKEKKRVPANAHLQAVLAEAVIAIVHEIELLHCNLTETDRTVVLLLFQLPLFGLRFLQSKSEIEISRQER